MTSVEITGMRDVLRVVHKFGDIKKYDEFHREVINETAELMRNFAPVREGYLEESIKVIRLGPNKCAIVVNVPYAEFMEWGTKYFPVGDPDSPRVRSSTITGKIAYHPFMRTAVWIMDDNYSEIFKRILFYK